MRKRTVFIAGLVFVLATGLALAQQQPGDPTPAQNYRQATAGSPMSWDAELIMQPIVKSLTGRYNLNEEQEKYTRALMTQRVKKFLGQHERDTRDIIDELTTYQMNGQVPPPEAAKEFAQRAQPLLAAMYKEIIDGNMKWREILNDEQKKVHDGDLKGIDDAFQKFDAKFTRWAKGDVRSDPTSKVGDQPLSVMKPEDAWQYWVRSFIVNYRLDESQQVTAQSVLDELRKEAAAYRAGHKEEFADLDAKYQELTQSPPKTDPKELEAARAKVEILDKKREQLEGAISVGMFNRLKQKVGTIPRSDQRESYEKRKAVLDVDAQRGRELAGVRATSQPAASEPASRAASTRAQDKAATRIKGSKKLPKNSEQ